MPLIVPSGWDGWPADWGLSWNMSSPLNELVDIAWRCLDLNAMQLSTMPVYRTRDGEVISPADWMHNPDPRLYTSWHEFAKQLFWDYQIGEAFVMPTIASDAGSPLAFRVVPPWSVHVEIRNARRFYRLGGETGRDITGEVLHIRYKSSSECARGTGPLDQAGSRQLTAGILAKYLREFVQTGGSPTYTLETEDDLSPDEAQDLMHQWVESRVANSAAPPVLDKGVTLKTQFGMSPKDSAMLDLTQFTEARIAVLLGVPPFLVGLDTGDSDVYSNVQQVHDFHDRQTLRPMAVHVMAALSQWALPMTQTAELNRDEYSRPALKERAEAYKLLAEIGAISVQEVRDMERLTGDAPAIALTGGGDV